MKESISEQEEYTIHNCKNCKMNNQINKKDVRNDNSTLKRSTFDEETLGEYHPSKL